METFSGDGMGVFVYVVACPYDYGRCILKGVKLEAMGVDLWLVASNFW